MRRTARRGRGHIGSRGLEQITIGLLTDAAGFPLMVEAFEGNARRDHHDAADDPRVHGRPPAADVTIVADAGMISAGNKQAIEAAGLSFILGTKIPDIPYVVSRVAPRAPRRAAARRADPDPALARRAALTSAGTRSSTTSTGLIGPGARCTGSTSRSPRPRRAVAGKAPVKRNRFIRLVGADKSVNRTLEAKARALAGWKGYADAAVVPRSVGSLLVTLGCGAGSSA